MTTPLVEFAAFHPDVCHAQAGAARTEYTSAIAVWAYKNGMSPDQGAAPWSRSLSKPATRE